jgi:general secretion pathway protein G
MQARNGITMAASWMTWLQPFIGCLPRGEAVNEEVPGTRRDQQAGFTLLEILVVIVILGLLIGLVAPAVLRQLGGARVSIAHQSIARLGSVLDMYKLDVGSYPSTEEGLQALVQAPAGASNWNGPYVQSGKLPVDPWNHPYVYRDPSDRAGHDYDLCSPGPSGNASGDDMICN